MSLLEMSTSGRFALPQNICKHTPASSAREKLVLNCAASGPCNPNHHIKQKKTQENKKVKLLIQKPEMSFRALT